MCMIVKEKLLKEFLIIEGDFFLFEVLNLIDIIVSIYVFYYLIDDEKNVVIVKYS